MSNDINNICVSGVIAWIKTYSDQPRVVFSLRNANGSFYVEAPLTQASTLKRGNRVIVGGLLYSHFWHGVEHTRIQAETITHME